nr:helicase-associated domain-containing protein [Microbacterium halimionae]
MASLLALRGVNAAASWRDFYDAAAALLDSASIDRALVRAPRGVLEILVSSADSSAESTGSISPEIAHWLLARGLSNDDGHAYRAVAERARASEKPAAPTGELAPDADDVAPDPAESSAIDTAAAAERAFTAVSALTDVLLACQQAPLQRVGSGAVGAADRRRLIESAAVADGDELEDLLGAAEDAALIRGIDREWIVTSEGEQWLSADTVSRWSQVAKSMVERLPDGIRTAHGGIYQPNAWRAAYPLDSSWPARAVLLHRRLVRWALFLPNGTVPPWAAAVHAGVDPDPATLSAAFPAEIDRIYLQADLSAIAPGPLLPRVEMRLRTMAERESRAQASTYRFSDSSLSSAIASGETAESLRAFLSEISLTGIPQPLDYLIERASDRHGLVRVLVDEVSGRTHVESDDPHVLATIAVDQSVRSVGLVFDETVLATGVGREAVYWMLIDAGYPAMALGSDGERQQIRRRATPGRGTALSPIERFGGLISQLRAGTPADADIDTVWRERELDRAVREHEILIIEVALPGGATRSFTIEATGIGGGRLRGRDRAADVERTLPITSIVRVDRA